MLAAGHTPAATVSCRFHTALTAALQPPLPQEEGARAAKAREAMSAKLLQLEKQRGEVERTRDELKVGCGRRVGEG